jgi:hypothetical protein
MNLFTHIEPPDLRDLLSPAAWQARHFRRIKADAEAARKAEFRARLDAHVTRPDRPVSPLVPAKPVGIPERIARRLRALIGG